MCFVCLCRDPYKAVQHYVGHTQDCMDALDYLQAPTQHDLHEYLHSIRGTCSHRHPSKTFVLSWHQAHSGCSKCLDPGTIAIGDRCLYGKTLD